LKPEGIWVDESPKSNCRGCGTEAAKRESDTESFELSDMPYNRTGTA